MTLSQWSKARAHKDLEASLQTYQVGAHFEALNQLVLMPPSDSRYTQVVLPPFNISRNIDFQPGFLKSGLTKINFDNGFEFLRSFSWFAIVLVLALK